MSRREPPGAAILALLLLALLLAGCATPEPGAGTTTTLPPTPETPAPPIKIPGPSGFRLDQLVPLPGEHGERVVAYGYLYSPKQPFISVYDAGSHAWTSASLSTVPASVVRISAAAASDGTILVMAGIYQDPTGLNYINVAAFDGTAWHLEERPTRWLQLQPFGAASIGTRTYAIFGGGDLQKAVQLWHTDDHGASWQADAPVPDVPAWAWLSGNATHLQICGMDSQSDVVLLTRQPNDALYDRQVVWKAPGPYVLGGFTCLLAPPVQGPPLLAWQELVLAMGQDRPNGIVVARNTNGTWNVDEVVKDGNGVEGLWEGPNGALLYGYDGSWPHVWRLAGEAWHECPPPGGGDPHESGGVFTWGDKPVFATRNPFPAPEGLVRLQPLDPVRPDCLARV